MQAEFALVTVAMVSKGYKLTYLTLFIPFKFIYTC